MIETMEKWYHEWQQKARERYLAGYYPNHERVPNCVVRGLYGIGYFFGDFVPLILNFIDSVYMTIKRLVGFIVGLLIEASIFIVLIGSIAFSITHSIERLREAGATGGLEYIGVLMFEVIFVSSAATLTGFLMKKKKPNGFIEWVGLIFTIAGFGVGLAFVWWSNVNGMATTREGLIIGSAVPLLVLIGEGVLAYRYLIETKKDDQTQLLEIIQRNGLTVGDVLKAIDMYKKADTGQMDTDNRTDTDKTARTKSDGRTTDSTDTDTIPDSNSDRQSIPDGHSDNEQDGQADTDRQTTSDTKPDNMTDTDEQRDGHSDSLTDTSGRTDADTDSGQTDTDGHPDSDSNSDTTPDTDRQTSADTPDRQEVSGGQISNVRSGQADTDKTVQTKSNIVPFKKPDTAPDKGTDIEQAKQFALDYYRQNKKHISIRKLADACGIKKHQAEKIRKELEQELGQRRFGRN